MKITDKFLILIFSLLLANGHAKAFNIDETVDDEIRKNYNPAQLIHDVKIKETALDKKIQTTPQAAEEKLPELPRILKSENSTKQPEVNNKSTSTTLPPIFTGGNIKVKSGTSFNVTSNVSISDWQRKGTKIKFTTSENTYGKNFTIPRGTVFLGEIIDSHKPQITGNGGLIVIKVDSMIYKGQTIPVAAYITRANNKKIFLNNIKGERKYLKTTWSKGNWGRVMFDKMLAVTVGLGAENSTLILTPFPLAYGTLCLGLNTITSPICAFFSKGGTVSIPAGSPYQIKLVDEIMID